MIDYENDEFKSDKRGQLKIKKATFSIAVFFKTLYFSILNNFIYKNIFCDVKKKRTHRFFLAVK